MKVLLEEKVSRLKAAMSDHQISTAELKQYLEDFRQHLFAIGADVYSKVNNQSDEVTEVAESPLSSTLGNSIHGTPTPQFNFNLENESTLQADYEAIE